MFTVFTTYLIRHECPAGMTERNCPLRKHLKEQKLFHFGANETMLEPTAELYRLARAEYVQEIDHMNQICYHCQQKTK